MILLGKILYILCIMMFTEGVNTHLMRDRKTKYYREDEIEMKADSLMNHWAEEQMKYDSL